MKKMFFYIVGMLLFLPLVTGCWDMGGGEKIGTITRINRMGIICKTWEAEIIRGGLNTGSGVMGQAFHFTIEDDSLAKEVERFMNNQQEVKITYKKEGVTLCRSDSDDVFLSKIEPLNIVSVPPVQKIIPKEETSYATPSDDMSQIIKRQLQILEQNQQIMMKLLEERN